MAFWHGLSPAGIFAVFGYMACSASMLIANKVAVHILPAPSTILIAQLMGTAIVVRTAHALGFIEKLDGLEWRKVRAFTPVAAIFTSTILTNMLSLQYANVETFMVFRFSTPLAISVADYLFLGRELPSIGSWISLLSLLAGGVGYMLTDSSFDVRGYLFCALWFVIFCIDQVYLKHVVHSITMESNWGRVYYSNLLSCVPLILVSTLQGEHISVLESIDLAGFSAVLVTTAMGTAMSYFAWSARAAVSATTFTVVGNTCKILTIACNVAIWEHHADAAGMFFLFCSFVGAYFYKQAPMRSAAKQSKEEEGEALGAASRAELGEGKGETEMTDSSRGDATDEFN